MSVPSGLAGVLVSSTPMFVALSDRLGRRAVIMGGALFGLLFAFPLFWMLDTGDMFLVWLAFALGIAVCVNSTFAPQGAYFTELFDPRVRYSGFAAALLAWTAGDPWSISAYLALLSLITLVATYLAPETLRK
ncbi:MAG TPA: MFS transporter [Rubrobacteraceae bacterium]|nr:MFS transporter [Rubrobacteraceae bacterium]